MPGKKRLDSGGGAGGASVIRNKNTGSTSSPRPLPGSTSEFWSAAPLEIAAVSAPPGKTWTAEQQRGISAGGRSILVSAAAGSGKTTVLAQRCVYLVCDGPQPCNVDELLVVTFTESAAIEMKSRIHAALRARCEAAPNERLSRQLALVDQAQVSTLHGFCARLLRQYFHLAGLDPAFRVLDDEEARLLRSDIARQLFDDRYELDPDGSFHRFVDAYGEGNDDRLIQKVIATHEMLTSLVNPERWLQDAIERLREPIEGPFEQSRLGRKLIEGIEAGLGAAQVQCSEAIEQVRSLGFEKYSQFLSELLRTLGYWHGALKSDGLDALVEVASEPAWPPLPQYPNSTPRKDLAKGLVDSVRAAVKSGPWRETLGFTSQQWRDGLAQVLPHAEVFTSLVQQFSTRYRAAKDASRAVDFSDLERFALDLLRQTGTADRPSDVARACHRRFAHVLVDEYQDINEVQDAILNLASRESIAGRGSTPSNLFCVGDVKQSIYRFRLAEPKRFLERQRRFRADVVERRGEVIDLQANFRSRAPLLGAINAVFERLMSEAAADIRYDNSHFLHPELKFPPGDASCFTGSPMELHLLPKALAASEIDEDAVDEIELDRTEREAALVAHRIRQLIGLEGEAPRQVMEQAGFTMQPRPIRCSDIVILLRSMRYKAEQYVAALRRAGLPVHSDSVTGFFESTEIRDVLSLLALLDNQCQDIPMAAVLRSPVGALHDPEDALARIRLAYPDGPVEVPFHEAVVRYSKEQDDELAARLRDLLGELNEWRESARRRPLAELLRNVYEKTGYLAFCAGLSEGNQRVANLVYLQDRAGQFDHFQRRGLSQFLQFLHDLRAESDLGAPSVASEADNVVRIMTIHRSKGLEFPVVVLPDLGKHINLQDCHGAILADRDAGLGMSVVDVQRLVRYPSLGSHLVKEGLRQQALAEELRVLYVAMTRAKEHLILVGTASDSNVESWTARWSAHAGHFPTDMILGAQSMLDWIGPVAAATSKSAAPVFELIAHRADEACLSPGSNLRREAFTAEQVRRAELKPLDVAPPLGPVAQGVIDRLSRHDRFDAFTRLPAVQSVTRRTKDAHALPPATGSAAGAASLLAAPKFLPLGAAPLATDRGTATHLVLQHLNFSHTGGADDVDRQIQALVARRVIGAEQAEWVDRSAIAWVHASEAGELLRLHAKLVRREIPVYFPVLPGPEAAAPASDDPLDRIMVRGRLDVLIPVPGGSIILDYKTDNVSGEQVGQRAELYRPQMLLYRQAIEAISGFPVARILLVFLTPREIRPIEP